MKITQIAEVSDNCEKMVFFFANKTKLLILGNGYNNNYGGDFNSGRPGGYPGGRPGGGYQG